MRSLAFVSLLVAAPAFASVPPSIMYVSAQPGMDKRLGAVVALSAYKAAKKTFGSSLILNWKALGRRPDKQFFACGSDLSCLAKLADKLKADRILYGRVSPAPGGGATLQMLVIGAVSETVEQRFSVAVTRPSEAQNAIGIQLAALDSAQGLSSAPDSEAALAPPPAAVVAPPTAPPEATGDAMAFGDDAAAAPPPPKPTAVAPAFADVASGGPPRQILLGPTRTPPAVAAQKSAPKHPWLLPTGIATAAVGAGALGAGVYFGLHQNQLLNTIHYGQGGSTQSQAVAITKQANQSAVTADALFIAGGIVTALGLSLLGASFF